MGISQRESRKLIIMSLSFYDFTLLPDEQQYELIFTEGEFINFREIGGSKFVLYNIYGFFVELQYNIANNNIVNKVAFKRAL